MVGSVETPTVYEPETTQVLRVPGAKHDVPGNPDGCSSVYPQPDLRHAGLRRARSSSRPTARASPTPPPRRSNTGARSLRRRSPAQQQPVCVRTRKQPVQGGLRGAACSPTARCTRTRDARSPRARAWAPRACAETQERPPRLRPKNPAYLKSGVGVLTLGPVQLAYSPGEVFPVHRDARADRRSADALPDRLLRTGQRKLLLRQPAADDAVDLRRDDAPVPLPRGPRRRHGRLHVPAGQLRGQRRRGPTSSRGRATRRRPRTAGTTASATGTPTTPRAPGPTSGWR